MTPQPYTDEQKREALQLAIVASGRFQREVEVIAGINAESQPYLERIGQSIAILESMKAELEARDE